VFSPWMQLRQTFELTLERWRQTEVGSYLAFRNARHQIAHCFEILLRMR